LARAQTKLGSNSINLLSDALKFIFSWVALLPIAIIVSGKFIAHIPAFKLTGQEGQMFGVRLPGVIDFVAKGDEVVYGFGLFIAEFFIVAIVAGHAVYNLVESDFGINLGQFNAICAFSAFSSVILSGLLLFGLAMSGRIRNRSDPIIQEHAAELDSLSRGEPPSPA
jgi:hypothetical protein